MGYGSPNTDNRVFSFSTKVGESIGPLAKGDTIPPILAEEGRTLPRVRSTSLTTIPGDARFNAILPSKTI